MKKFMIFLQLLIINLVGLLLSNVVGNSLLFAVEVEGEITTDTVWSPENNPYILTDQVYVNEGVTLTILPGTVVKGYAK